jgi:hypothetical protein
MRTFPVEKPTPEIIRRAVSLGGRLLIASADRENRPHIAAAGSIGMAAADRIAVSSWFCPATISNVAENPQVAVVIWDLVSDSGHQLLGRVETVQELEFLDGYLPEKDFELPQVERRLVIVVDKVIAFSPSAHSDQGE